MFLSIYFLIHFKGLIWGKNKFSSDYKSYFTLRDWEKKEEEKDKGERSRFHKERQGISSGIRRG